MYFLFFFFLFCSFFVIHSLFSFLGLSFVLMVVFFHSFSFNLSFVRSFYCYFIFPFIYFFFNLSFSFVLLFVPSIIIFFYVSFLISCSFWSFFFWHFILICISPFFFLPSVFFSDEAGKSDVLHLRTDVSNSAHGTHLWPFLLFMIIKILVSLWTDFIAVMNLKSMKMKKKLQPVYRTNYELFCLYILVVAVCE